MVGVPNPFDLIPGANDILKEVYKQTEKIVKDYVWRPIKVIVDIAFVAKDGIVGTINVLGKIVHLISDEWEIFNTWGPLIIFHWLLVLIEFQTHMMGELLAAVLNPIIGTISLGSATEPADKRKFFQQQSGKPENKGSW